MINEVYRKMINILQYQHNLLIVGHENPDCDCLGSMLAVYHAFDGLHKNWQIIMDDKIPATLGFLPGIVNIQRLKDINADDYDAVLLIDHCETNRSGVSITPYLTGKKLYCIDHHTGCIFRGDVAIIEPQAAAAAEIIAQLIFDANIKPDDSTAICLYSAIVADTGCFRYLNTTQRSLSIAARLRPQVDLETIRTQLFENRSPANIKMLGTFFSNFHTECDGRLAYSSLPYEDMCRNNASAADCHDIVNFTLSLTGVKIGILFEEYENHVKMSFRSYNGYRVDELAHELGGGGHMMAAGAKQTGRLNEIIPVVIDKAKKLV